MRKLDLLKDEWYFKPKSPEESAAFQKWAFEQGLSWNTHGKHVIGHVYADCIGGNGHKPRTLGHATETWYDERGHVKLTPVFKIEISVESVELPDVESSQEKKIRELEATVAEAQRQIQELKKEI